MQLGYSILVSTSGFQSFGRSLQAPANAQTCLLAEAEISRSAWYPRMQVLVEFVLHGPSSAFPCVTNDYAPYKQQVLFAVLRLYATDPRVCDVAAAAALASLDTKPNARFPPLPKDKFERWPELAATVRKTGSPKY